MEMNIIKKIRTIIKKSLVDNVNFIVEKTRNINHGDYATNVAIVLAKKLKTSPMLIAKEIVEKIKNNRFFASVTLVSPGFINMVISLDYYNKVLDQVILLKDDFGQYKKKKTLYEIEYVSANPTGLLHIGHARNAAFGKTLCNVWKKYGICVDSEYYVNDSGAQINRLGVAVLVRYLQLNDIDAIMPQDSYHGEEIKEVAQKLFENYQFKFIDTKYNDEKILNDDHRTIINNFSKGYLLNVIKKTLKKFRVNIKLYFYESTLYKKNLILKTFKKIPHKDTYKKDGALWLKTTKYGDDKDRVLVKNNGDLTYFMGDVCYHKIKYDRKPYDKLFNILGADHSSYICKMKAFLKILQYNSEKYHVLLMQMVKLFKSGEQFKMSKRSGKSLTLDDLINTIGVDCARWYLVSQSANTHLEIDVEKVLQKDQNNQFYYVLYAYARIYQILAKAKKHLKPVKKIDLLVLNKERELLSAITFYPILIEAVAKKYACQLITNYLFNLASLFHSYYAEVKIANFSQNYELSLQRIKLITAVSYVLKSALKLLDIKPQKKI